MFSLFSLLIQSVLNSPTNHIQLLKYFLYLTYPWSRQQRRKYESSLNLKVFEVANAINNCAAARIFNVTEKMVKDWGNEDNLRNMRNEKHSLATV